MHYKQSQKNAKLNPTEKNFFSSFEFSLVCSNAVLRSFLSFAALVAFKKHKETKS
jgi:hypothetical protein